MSDPEVIYIHLNNVTLPDNIRVTAEKLASIDKYDGENVLSTGDFEALDKHLEYAPEELSSYCSSIQELYTYIGLGDMLNCVPGITKFAEHANTLLTGIAVKVAPKPEGPYVEIHNFSEEAKLAALEYAGTVLISSVNLKKHFQRMLKDGFEITVNGNHYNISKNGISMEFDTLLLDSGRTAVDKISIKKDGRLTPIEEWPKLITGFLSYTVIFGEVFYCNWRMLGGGLILFDTNSSSLNSFAKVYIKALSDVLHKYPNIELTIIGNADSVGKSQSNMELASARAQTVRKELKRLGIKENRLAIVSYGEDSPVDAKIDNKANQHNRNVQVLARYRHDDGRYANAIAYNQTERGDIVLATDIQTPAECRISAPKADETFGE